MHLILASGSLRRKEILEEFKINFEVIVPNIDESMDDMKTPYENVKMVALKKAKSVKENHNDSVVLACDTVVVLDGKIYGKPKSRSDAYEMLSKFSNKTHEVISGVAILANGYESNFYTVSYVTFKELTDEQINKYLDTDEPYDKAGSYAIQGKGRDLIKGYSGSLYNIIGLPIEDVKLKLDEILGD